MIPLKDQGRRNCFDDAKVMLEQIIKQKWLKANGVFALLPANSEGNSIHVL